MQECDDEAAPCQFRAKLTVRFTSTGGAVTSTAQGPTRWTNFKHDGRNSINTITIQFVAGALHLQNSNGEC